MQIFGLNEEGEKVEAVLALKRVDYTCLECGAPLRVRRGFYQVAHFYHFKVGKPCSQRKKGKVHLNIQLDLQKRLQAKMEVRFPEISRIADVVWEEKRLVFEIQVSPISDAEVQARMNDYQSIGYSVVWILYDKTFNQDKLSAAEHYLKDFTHYYSDGAIYYDQVSLIKKGFLVKRLMRKQIVISSPQVPSFERFGRKWKIGFEGDLNSSLSLNPKLLEEYAAFMMPKRNRFSFLVHLYNYFLLKASN